MPLDNKFLSPELLEIMHNLSYQEKVNIYDTKCKNCGYALIKVGDFETRSIEEAIDIAECNGEDIERGCDYPEDVEERYGKDIYLPLTTIVTNGCRFWDIKNIEDGYAEKELPEQRCTGESISDLVIP